MPRPVLLSATVLTLCGLTATAQNSAVLIPTSTQNYIVTQSPRTAQTVVSFTTTHQTAPATVEYFDGLGRPKQVVQVRAAGDAANDFVTGSLIYDAYGRPQRTYIPAPSGFTSGIYLSSVQPLGEVFYNDLNPYSETVHEPSPLNRPTQQFGPGQAWRAGAGRPQSFTYGVAGGIVRFKASQVALFGNIDGQNAWDYFGRNDIATRISLDEQGNRRIDYTDLQGRLIRQDLVLAPGDTLTTAYAYDNFERLTAVVPPKLYRWFRDPGNNPINFYLPYSLGNGDPNPVFKELAYVYLHDKRSRLVTKHIPGAGWTEMVYDRLDRLVLSQDQQDKADGRWRFIRYDGLNREVMSGRTTLTVSGLDVLREEFLYKATPLSEERGTALLGYTNQSFPASVPISETAVLTVNYYDTTPTNTPFTFQASGALGTAWGSTTGQLTGTKVRNLETNVWYDSRFWYDFKGRLIQSQRQNHLGGTDRVDTDYRFNGEVAQSVLRHQKGAGGPISTVATSYTHDHQSRPTQVTHSIDGATPTLLATYNYDNVGRLAYKKLGSPPGGTTARSVQTGLWTQAGTWQGGTVPTPALNVSINAGHTVTIPASTTVWAANLFDASRLVFQNGSVLRLSGSTQLQRIDYAWHIRGWLRGLNLNANNAPDLSGGRQFALKLDYETAGQYGGSIGSQTWFHTREPAQARSYTYAYDKADRLAGATYAGASGENFSLSNLTYDPNGNIQTLNRAGADALVYSYTSVGNSSLYTNKPTRVSDAQSNPLGFADGTNTGDDYTYWPDGSLKQDLNRNITLIEYNHFKLPRRVTFSTGKVVTYQYDATGQKLQMSLTGAGTESRDYLGPFQYLNGALFEIGHEEGRYTPTGGYEYFHKDHLSNVRAVFSATGVSQYTDYDPWGLALWGSLSGGASSNRNQYNGKETTAELGANLLDYGARLYDSSVPRFWQVDPLAEMNRRFSPFVYGNANPMRFIDPDGRTAVPAPGYYEGAEAQDLFRQVQASIAGQPQTTDGEGEGGPGKGQKAGNTQVPMNKLNPFAMAKLGQAIPIHESYTRDENITMGIVASSFALEFIGPGAILTGWLARILGRSAEVAAPAVLESAAIEMTTVGRWMSKAEYEIMANSSKMVEGAGGQTFVATGGSEAFNAAAKGSVYAEFQVPTNSLLQGGQANWFKVLGPNAGKAMQGALQKQGGQLLPQIQNLTPILKVKQL
jgi:RHS repeat-associated protein